MISVLLTSPKAAAAENSLYRSDGKRHTERRTPHHGTRMITISWESLRNIVWRNKTASCHPCTECRHTRTTHTLGCTRLSTLTPLRLLPQMIAALHEALVAMPLTEVEWRPKMERYVRGGQWQRAVSLLKRSRGGRRSRTRWLSAAITACARAEPPAWRSLYRCSRSAARPTRRPQGLWRCDQCLPYRMAHCS